MVGIQRIESYPQIDVRASSRYSNGADSSISGTGQRHVVFIEPEVSWEADLWGRLRRLNEAARASLLSTEEARRGVIMTVVADVARAYLELRDLDSEAAIAERQVDIRRSSLDIARIRFRGGLTPELDVREGENALADAEATRAGLLLQRTQKENELSVLIGHEPAEIPRGLPLDEQPFPEEIPAGLPSSLLDRRPDIRAAEENVHAANSRIGAAIAATYPGISLTGAGGSVSSELEDLFSPGTWFWRFAGNLLQPVIDKDRNRKQVAAEQARTNEAIGEFEKTVLGAFQEVDDGLVAVTRTREQAEAAAAASTAAARSVRLATLRYEGGVDNYLNLLDAQRVYLNSELREVQLRRQHRVAIVMLYKALGGGWDPVTDSLAMPRQAP